MSKQPHFRRGLRATAVWLSALVTMAAATVFTVEPARAADEELIILSLADGNGVIRDVVVAMDDPKKDKDKGLSIVFTDEGGDTRNFYAGPAYPEPLDSDCAGVDLSQAQWNGKMAYVFAGDITIKTIVYRMGANFDSKKEIKDIYASTVQHGYFREVTAGDGASCPNGWLVRATGDGDPPADTDYTLCVVWVKL
jgi:hypothetical protein